MTETVIAAAPLETIAGAPATLGDHAREVLLVASMA